MPTVFSIEQVFPVVMATFLAGYGVARFQNSQAAKKKEAGRRKRKPAGVVKPLARKASSKRSANCLSK